MYCNIIVTRPFNHVFTYDVGSAKVRNGQIVLVPFGKSTEVGMIFEINVSKPNYQIKKVLKIFDSLCFDKITIKFIQWINDYTLAPIGSVFKLFLINDLTNSKANSRISGERSTPPIAETIDLIRFNKGSVIRKRKSQTIYTN